MTVFIFQDDTELENEKRRFMLTAEREGRQRRLEREEMELLVHLIPVTLLGLRLLFLCYLRLVHVGR